MVKEARGGRFLGAEVTEGCGAEVVLGGELGPSERATQGLHC